MVRIDVEIAGGQQIVEELQATHKQVEAALRSTVRKVAGWLRTRAYRGLAPALDIPIKVLRRRLKTFALKTSPDGTQMTLWFGLNPVGLIYLGAKQTKAGVTAYKRKVPGGFIAKGQVFKRTGKGRLPIERQAADVQDQAQIYLEDELLADADVERRFFQVFESELKWRTRN